MKIQLQKVQYTYDNTTAKKYNTAKSTIYV